jgi:PqqD family protein of HPr-rel-A system
MRSYAPGRKLSGLMSVQPGTQPDPSPDESGTPPGQMTVPAEYRPAKGADVLELDMGDGLILFNHDSSLVHHLNPSAALVWQLCNGEASAGELAAEIAEEYGLGGDEVFQQVASVIAEFDALDLVEDRRANADDRG